MTESIASADPDSDSDFEVVAVDFDALDDASDQEAGTELAPVTPSVAPQDFPREKHLIHQCFVCRNAWTLDRLNTSRTSQVYVFRHGAVLRGMSHHPCSFVSLCRSHQSWFFDDLRLLLRIELDPQRNKPKLDGLVEFIVDRPNRRPEVVFSGRIHTPRNYACSCPPTIIRSAPSDLAFESMRASIGECREHETCTAAPPFNPLRLVHIHGPEHVVLYTPDPSETIEYAVLSYCWGGPQDCASTSSNRVERHTVGFSIRELSKTVREAIEVTSRLGLQYLWADCLCIIQDDETDKESQIAQMPRIYASAKVAISASCGARVSQGFLESSAVPNLFHFLLEPFGEVRVLVKDSVDAGVEPLDRRAWALQETVLSRRILNFTSRSITFECSSVNSLIDHIAGASESKRRDVNFLRRLSRLLQTDDRAENFDTLAAWNHLVTAYTRRELTVSDDRLLAISGLADRFAGRIRDSYHAGIWEKQLPGALLWFCPRPVRRPLTDRAPSWSWASIDGPVSFDFDFPATSKSSLTRQSLKLHGVSVIPVQEKAPFGAVRPGGCICVSGLKRPVRIVEEDGERKVFDPVSGALMKVEIYPDVVDDDTSQPIEAHFLNYMATNANIIDPMTQSIFTAGILLTAMPGVEGRYKRLGLYNANGITDWFRGCGLETIHIF